MKKLWNGVVMQSESGAPVFVRAALLCTSCDIPASRKVSGFVGHSAYHGCSRCLKPFPTEAFGEKPNYCGTDRSNWPPRSKESHLKHALEHKSANTKEKQKLIEREHGCRYSVLIELQYYDIVRFCIIDPMHNLLLGTAKHVLSIWVSQDIIDKTQLATIQSIVDNFITPTNIGRIPLKIASGFSGFTAEQWRNWVLIFSLCSIKGCVPYRHYDCWLLFVKAVNLLCSRQITLQEVDQADTLLMEFCQSFEHLYGKDHYTINLHLHGHLKDCILDFGPVYSFWLFAFERLNGVLGAYHTNCRDISLQLMRRFSSSNFYGMHNLPQEYREDFAKLLAHHQYQEGSLHSSTIEEALKHCNIDSIKPLPPIREVAWAQHQKYALTEYMSSFLGCNSSLLSLYQKAPALNIDGFVLGSLTSRFVTNAHVMALHPKFLDQVYLAEIDHFAKLDVKNDSVSNESVQSLWTACLQFHFEHDCKKWFGGPTEVWSKAKSCDVYYIPLTFIKSRVAICETEVNFGTVIGKQSVKVVSILSNFCN